MSKLDEPDYLNLVKNYQLLSNGQRAEIRRTVEPEALLDIPAFYQLIQKTELKPNAQSCRLVWFLPVVTHADESSPLGRVMANKDVNERRLFQIVRSEYPNDLIQFRRILQQIKPSQNWKSFGTLLYYWGITKDGSKKSKQTLLKDYYLKPTETV